MNRKQFLDSVAAGFEPSAYVLDRIHNLDKKHPGFAEKVLTTMEEAGASYIRVYYDDVLEARKAMQKKAAEDVAEWFAEELASTGKTRRFNTISGKELQEMKWKYKTF